MNSCDLSALCPLRPGLQRFHDPTYFSCLFPDLKTICSTTPVIPCIVSRGSMQPFYSHLLISSTHLNQMTGLMIPMTKAGFAVPHRHFFPTCILTAYFFLSFEPTGLANAITGHHRLNFYSLFFYIIGVSGVQNGRIDTKARLSKIETDSSVYFCLVPVILSEAPISFGFCFPWLLSHFRLVISCHSPIFHLAA